MKEVKYELCAQSKMHLYELRQVAKVQLGGNILIFLKLVWSKHIFVYLFTCLQNGQKIEK